jgi:hypothetical protein
MSDWSKLANFRLLRGSHLTPDDGCCLVEAALIAGGFPYRSIYYASDCPPCFSRPIAGYAISINDAMPDTLRQELLVPYITRLAGTAHDVRVETRRSEVIRTFLNQNAWRVNPDGEVPRSSWWSDREYWIRATHVLDEAIRMGRHRPSDIALKDVIPQTIFVA